MDCTADNGDERLEKSFGELGRQEPGMDGRREIADGRKQMQHGTGMKRERARRRGRITGGAEAAQENTTGRIAGKMAE